MKRTILVISLVSLLAGCMTDSTRESMQKDPATLKQSKTFSEDYKVIYDRVSRKSDVCYQDAKSELHEDEGYGQVDVINPYEVNYLLTARIEKAGSGTKITAESGNNWAKQKYIDDIWRWAAGDHLCTPGWIF